MNVNQLPTQSYTGRRGNTVYWGGASATNDAGTRGAGVGYIGFDRGSDGSLDAGLAFGAAAGPNGVVGGAAAFGPNAHGGKAFATNGEAARVWSRYVPH